MNNVTQLVLAIIGAIIIWTTSVITGMLWLTNKFRSLEATIHRESNRNRQMFETQLHHHATRLLRLEIKAFGYSGTNGGSVIPDDGESFPGG